MAHTRVKNWQSHNFFFWLGIVGTVGTLIGVVLSVYFYQVSQIQPLLTFGVHPLKTELQRPDYDKELGFNYKGKPVESESVTSVQVSIWNAGTRSIRDSDVLDPFRLVMPEGSAILSVRVKKMSRPICGFALIDSEEDYKSGTCRLTWRILEPSDGAVLQIIYAGSARRDPTLTGVVAGQREGVLVQRYDLSSDRKPVLLSNISTPRFVLVVGLMVVAVLFMLLPNRIHAKTAGVKQLTEEKTEVAKHLAELTKKVGTPSPSIFLLCFAGAALALLVCFWVLGIGVSPGPPFGW